MKACATGKTIGDAMITIRKAGGDKPVEYFEGRSERSVRLPVPCRRNRTNGGMARGQFGLNFAKVEFRYTPQEADGTGGAVVSGGYDIKKNEPV